MDKKKDRLIILILLFIIFIFGILLYRNIMKRSGAGDNPVIGILKFKNHVIERKYDSEVLWDTVESGIEIRNKDTIRSGDYSDAVLILNDDTRIGINENSMIYLDFSDGMNLNFAYGSMSLEKSGNSGEALKITSGDKTVEVKETSLVMEKKNKEELDFTVKKGNAKIITGKEEKILETNQKATIAKDNIEIEKVSFTLKSPEDYAVVSSKNSEVPVNFEWSSAGNITQQKLEISYESKFKKIQRSVPVNGNSTTVSLSPGSFYWRISGLDTKKGDTTTSNFRKLKTIGIIAARIISPNNNQKFIYSTQNPIIQFSWTKVDEVKGYQLELTSDKDFSNVLKSFPSRQNYIGVDNLEPGTYYARVITEFTTSDINKEFSKPIAFTIQKQKEPDPPRLLSPTNGQHLNKYSFARGKYYFQWKDSVEFVSYQLEISGDANFGNILKQETASYNQAKVAANLENGNYYWRVKGTPKSGGEQIVSKVNSFTIQSIDRLDLVSPANNSTFELDGNKISFQWKKIDFDPNFVLEISELENFSNLAISKKTNYYSETLKMNSAGTYYWRVRALDENGKEILKSPALSFQITDLQDPVIRFPLENQRVDMSKRDSLEFLWEEDARIEYYEMEFYDKKKGVLLAKTRTKANRYIFKDLLKLDEGPFYWSIRGFVNTKSGKSSTDKVTTPFSIFLSEKPNLPNVKSKDKIYIEDK